MYIWIWIQLLYCCNISVLAQIPFQGIFIPSQNNIWLQRGWLVFSPNQMNPPTIPSQNNQRWSAIGCGQPPYGKESDQGYPRENGNQKDDQASEPPPLEEQLPEYVPTQIAENRNISDSTLETSNQTDEQQFTRPTTPTLNKNDIHETSSKEGDLKHSSEVSINEQDTFNTINNAKPKTRPPLIVTTTSGFTSRTMVKKEHLQKSAERKNARGNNDLPELNSPQSLENSFESGESTTVDTENNNNSETTSALNDGRKSSEPKTLGTENNESETTSNSSGKESPQDTLPHPNENDDDGKLHAPDSRSAVNSDNNSLSTPTATNETGPSKPETRDTESNNKSKTTSNDNGGEEPSQVSL